MPPPLLMTEVKPAAAKRGAEGAGLRSVMRRETIGLPARRRLYLLRSDERCPCRGQGPFRGLSLMIVFGAGASSCAAKCKKFAFSRLIEVTITTVPAGTSTGAADRAGRICCAVTPIFSCAPLEAGPVGPDAVQDDGDLASDRNLGLLGADTLHQPNAPRFQCRPTLRPVQQDACGLEQIGPQQPVAPFRDAAIVVLLAGLLPSRC